MFYPLVILQSGCGEPGVIIGQSLPSRKYSEMAQAMEMAQQRFDFYIDTIGKNLG